MTTIAESFELSNNINKYLDGITTSVDNKILFPGLFHSLVIEHHRSIIILCEQKLYSSAASLVRCIFESYVKGLWFAEFAEESDFEKLRNDAFTRKFSELVSQLDDTKNKGLKRAKEYYWPNLNSFTHSGTAQLSRRISNGQIVSNFSDELIQEMLSFSNDYALLSFGEIARISGNSNAQMHSLRLHHVRRNIVGC